MQERNSVARHPRVLQPGGVPRPLLLPQEDPKEGGQQDLPVQAVLGVEVQGPY